MITNTLRRWLEGIKQGTKLVTSAGSAQSDAAQIGDNAVVYVTNSDGTKGIKLPKSAPGPITVINAHASSVLKIYGQTDDTINKVTANSAYSLPAKTAATFYPTPGSTAGLTNWYGVIGAAMP